MSFIFVRVDSNNFYNTLFEDNFSTVIVEKIVWGDENLVKLSLLKPSEREVYDNSVSCCLEKLTISCDLSWFMHFDD